MSFTALPARHLFGLTLGLLAALLGLAVTPPAAAPAVPAPPGNEARLECCGQWLPVENLAGAEDIRRQPVPLLLRRPVEPVAELFRAPVRVRQAQGFCFRLVSGPPQRHRAVSDSGCRPLRL